MNMQHIQIYGSASSQDYDIAVFVESIPGIPEAHRLCEYYAHSLENMIAFARLPNKPVNVNLVKLYNGELIDCLHGTCDELNNSLLDTYGNHSQFYPQHITVRANRDKEWKLLRTARVILSFFSRTAARMQVKAALRGNLREKLFQLKELSPDMGRDWGKQKISAVDIYKTISFQLGQTLGLYRGLELYTKEDITDEYPLLAPFLFRDENEYVIENLVDYYQLFLGLCETQLETLGYYTEDTYIKTLKIK